MDYSYQINTKNTLLFGAGLNIWAFEQFDLIPGQTFPVPQELFEQNTSSLFQVNLGIRNHLFAIDKFNFFVQSKIIGGLGDAFGYTFTHLGLQPAIGASRQLNENHSLIFSVNYTKYFSRPLEGRALPNPESFGFIVGLGKRL